MIRGQRGKLEIYSNSYQDVCEEGIWNIEGQMEVDKEKEQTTVEEYAKCCGNLYSVAQFVHYKQRRIEEEWIIEAKNKLCKRVNKEEIREGSEIRG